MGKFEAKKEKKKFPVWIIVLTVAVLAVVLVLFLRTPEKTQQPTEPVPQTTAAAEAEQTQPQEQTEPAAEQTVSGDRIAFPATAADGALELQMLFQFSGVNPDCGYEEAENIAALELHNVSGSYLAKADLILTMADGTVYSFTVTELPAGTSVLAFDLENQLLAADAQCVDITCEAEFGQQYTEASSQLTWTVEDGIMITVTNTSDGDLSNIVVYCRSPFGEDYFGGMTYQYTIDELPAGESVTVEAWDCILGEADVVRIAIGES